MANATYSELNEWAQDLIDEVKILIGDVDPDEADKYFTNDQWAIILGLTVRDFNKTRPTTNYGIVDFPEPYTALMEMGMMYFAALTRSNHLIEYLPISGYAGPNIDFSQLWTRWNQRANDLRPMWIKSRNLAKLEFLPHGAGTVDVNGWYGRQSASIIPVLRALPSWGYSRG